MLVSFLSNYLICTGSCCRRACLMLTINGSLGLRKTWPLTKTGQVFMLPSIVSLRGFKEGGYSGSHWGSITNDATEAFSRTGYQSRQSYFHSQGMAFFIYLSYSLNECLRI